MELSNNEMARIAPSIFTNDSAETTSDKYSFIPTIAVIDAMRDTGWYPAKVQEQSVRKPDMDGFQKHLVRFYRPDLIHNGHRVEAVCINSHDAKTSFHFMLGVYRMVCTNGCIAGETFGDIRIRHSGTTLDEVVGASRQLTDNAPRLIDEMDEMSTIDLSADERGVFAMGAHALLYDDPENSPIRPVDLLSIRRVQDRSPDLWTTYQTVQENVIKGGIPGVTRSKRTGRQRRMRTRPVKAIERDKKLNRSLFILAEEMKRLKKGE